MVSVRTGTMVGGGSGSAARKSPEKKPRRGEGWKTVWRKPSIGELISASPAAEVVIGARLQTCTSLSSVGMTLYWPLQEMAARVRGMRTEDRKKWSLMRP